MTSMLVTGGARYYGSHAVRLLNECGYNVVVVGNLSRRHWAAVVFTSTTDARVLV